MRATILGWSAFSGLILGLFAGLMVFALVVIGGELAPNVLARLNGRVRVVVSIFSFVVLPVVGAVLGWLEGRLKLQ
jgi:hypothetical protein